MIQDALNAIDPARLWWQPLRRWLPGGERWEKVISAGPHDPAALISKDEQAGIPVADILNRLAPPGFHLQFVHQSALPPGMAYEQFIFDTGQCPTRDNLHDFFNGLCWFRFPQVKSLFNLLQARQIRRQGVGQHRGIIRDTITLLDEGGMFLLAPPSLWEAIRERDWKRAFVLERDLWRQTRTAIVGHALLEKCVTPYRAITANVIAIPPGTPAEDIDDVMARELERLLDDSLQAKPQQPLPVMGIPGWDPASEDSAFYDDLTVFRPPRPRTS